MARHAVKATREGLRGHATSTGYRIDALVPFVALPAAAAQRQWVVVTYKDKSVRALVLDVGPWNTNDNAYVFGDGTVRPQAESGTDDTNRPTNGAGIDLGEKVWAALGLPEEGGSADVEWEFEADVVGGDK